MVFLLWISIEYIGCMVVCVFCVDTGYRQQDRYYNNGRYAQPYERGYSGGYNQRGYSNRGYVKGDRSGDRPSGQAGTGAFLDSRRLRGDEIDVKDQQEFDFDAAKKDFDQTKDDEMEALAHAVDSMALEAAHAAKGGKAKDDKEENGDGHDGDDQSGAGKKDEEVCGHYVCFLRAPSMS